ncbi:hypothetical protein N9J59_05030 [Gammaproteobacteria bacterium]|nr:hypothetical protein [Gammaproteobacteria bacterium]
MVPDLFKEGSGVVVLGYLFEGSIKAEKSSSKT